MRVNLSQALKDILEDYTDEVVEGIEEVLEDVGEEAAKELRSAGDFKGTKYRRSWTSETEKKRTFTSVQVFNKLHYRLTHLLENGHRIVSKSGQTVGTAAAFPHIAEVNEHAQEEAVRRIEELIRKG